MNKKGRRSFGYIRKLPSGRFQASYVGADGRRYFAPGSYKTARDANDWLSKRHSEIQREVWEPPTLGRVDSQITTEIESAATLDSVIEKFLATRLTKGAKPLRENTKDLYRRLTNSALRDFKELPLASIDSQMVEDWYLNRVAKSKITTASKGYKLLKMVMGWAIKEGLIQHNPCNIVGAQSATSEKPVESPLPEEVRAISSHMPDYLQFAVILGSYAGLRFGELTELRRKDLIFYLENGEEHVKLNLRRGVTYFNKGFHVGPPKSKLGVRVIEVNKQLVPELRRHLNRFTPPGKEALLFPSKLGSWLRHDTFIKAWNNALSISGLDGRHLVPHSMRHFGATQLVIAGATLPELKKWLGDSSTAAVSRYLHATNRNRGLANSMEFA
jgi:integrase